MKKVAKKSIKVESIITDDQIRVKAFEVYKRDKCNDNNRNWFQAIKELKTL